jgi:hypothetical protein
VESDWYSDDPVKNSAGKLFRDRRGFALLCTSVIAVVVFLNSTFAANVSINSGRNVEFGQGIGAITSCDSSLSITPYSGFSNVQGIGGTFNFIRVKISGIDSNSCNGDSFVIKAWNSSSQVPLPLFESYTVAIVNVIYYLDTSTSSYKSGFSLPVYQGTLNISDSSTSLNSASVTLDFGSSSSVANSIYKFTLESIPTNSPNLQYATLQTLQAIQVPNGTTLCPYGGYGGFAGSIDWGSGYFCSPFPNGTSQGVINNSVGLFYSWYGYNV